MTATELWGAEIAVEDVRGVPCQVYRPRPPNLAAVLRQAGAWGDRTYLADESRRLSYAGLVGEAERVAGLLAGHGVRRGDPVLLLGRNSVDWVVALWGCWVRGAVAVLGNAWWTHAQTADLVSRVGMRLAMVDEQRTPGVAEVGRCPVVPLEGLAAAAASVPPDPADVDPADVDEADVDAADVDPAADEPVAEDDAAIMLFTSGTSGVPKGAVLSHRSIIGNQHNLLTRAGRLPAPGSGSARPPVVSLLATPLFHIGGVQAVLTALCTGGRLVLHTRRFDPVEVLRTIERERVAVWGTVPTTVRRVVEVAEAGTYDLSSVRVIGLGGAPLPPALITRAVEVFPNLRRGVTTNYGLTEAGGSVATAIGRDVLERPGTSGLPLPTVELRVEASGEILIRTAARMTGYWGEPEPPVDADGWLHTGDVGHLDAEGYLFVTDRAKDVVIRGGENISASHVEFALAAHPGVAAVAVVGLPHEDLGEELAAAVVPVPGAVLDARTLVAFAADRLARFEVPTRWWFRTDPLPETVSAKVNKVALRAAWPDS